MLCKEKMTSITFNIINIFKLILYLILFFHITFLALSDAD